MLNSALKMPAILNSAVCAARLLCQRTTDEDIVRLFWYGVAITLPFFGVFFMRVNLGVYHIALPDLGIVAIVAAGSLMFFMLHDNLHRRLSVKKYYPLFLLTVIFVFIHLIGLVQSINLVAGIKDMLKITSGVFTFWVTILFFPRDSAFIKRFFFCALYSWFVMLALLIYYYAFVFHVPFLGTELDASSKYGKNQLAFQLVIIFQYAFFLFLDSKRKITVIAPLLILVMAAIYAGSRMCWIAITLGLIYTSYFMLKHYELKSLKSIIKIVLSVVLFVAMGFVILSHYVNLIETSQRLISIFAPSKLPADSYLGRSSYSVRGGTILDALNVYITSPVIGVGLANTTQYIERLTHNDYAAILMELGSLGLLFFFLIVFYVWKISSSPVDYYKNHIQWYSFAGRTSFLCLLICSNFFNSYFTAYYWLYMAFFVVLSETEKREEFGKCEY